MHVLKVRGVFEAFSQGLELIRAHGQLESSRNGPVLRIPRPVTTIYLKPEERVLVDPVRDANPFFHLIEALWILAGRQDVATLTQYNKKMADYSDDGETFHAAYGYRLRNHFDMDQVDVAIQVLKERPNSRQVVLSIWDPREDLELDPFTQDIPCNDMLKFEMVDGALNLIVFNRSNDMIWGAYGANAVQFSVLLEYVAAMVGVPMGTYTQISTNFHVYLDQWDKYQAYVPSAAGIYAVGCTTMPLVTIPDEFNTDLVRFFRWHEGIVEQSRDCAPPEVYDVPRHIFANAFFPHVAVPMAAAWAIRRAGSPNMAQSLLRSVSAMDWRIAALQWTAKRDKKS